MVAVASFQSSLEWGQIGESAIAQWLRKRGWSILPVYEKEIDTGKGPRLFTAYTSGYDNLIAPDMMAMKGSQMHWVEAKRKSVFTWRRVPYGRWQTGIDLRHYLDYLHVREHTGYPLWIFFLHESNIPSAIDLKYPNCPRYCPAGLYGGEILDLKQKEDHQDSFDRYGYSYPMVYWNEKDLKHLAYLPDIKPVQEELELEEMCW